MDFMDEYKRQDTAGKREKLAELRQARRSEGIRDFIDVYHELVNQAVGRDSTILDGGMPVKAAFINAAVALVLVESLKEIDESLQQIEGS